MGFWINQFREDPAASPQCMLHHINCALYDHTKGTLNYYWRPKQHYKVNKTVILKHCSSLCLHALTAKPVCLINWFKEEPAHKSICFLRCPLNMQTRLSGLNWKTWRAQTHNECTQRDKSSLHQYDASVRLSPTSRLTETLEMFKVLGKLGMFLSLWLKWINLLLEHQKAHPAENIESVSPGRSGTVKHKNHQSFIFTKIRASHDNTKPSKS